MNMIYINIHYDFTSIKFILYYSSKLNWTFETIDSKNVNCSFVQKMCKISFTKTDFVSVEIRFAPFFKLSLNLGSILNHNNPKKWKWERNSKFSFSICRFPNYSKK